MSRKCLNFQEKILEETLKNPNFNKDKICPLRNFQNMSLQNFERKKFHSDNAMTENKSASSFKKLILKS